MKTRFAAAALVATAALALSACAPSEAGPSPSPIDPTLAADIAVLETFTWTEEDGQPVLTFGVPATVTASAALLVEDGDGEALAVGQDVGVNFVAFQGSDAAVLFSTYAEGGPETLPLDEAQLDPVLYDVLINAHVGAELIYGVSDGEAAGGSSMFFAMTVTSVSDPVVPLPRAEGTAVEPVAGLPTVTLDDAGAPSISFDGAEKPTELVVQPLIVGEGDPVAVGDTVTVHYTGWVWGSPTDEPFDSSWASGAPATFELVSGGLIEGWVQGLAGAPVGSQVLLVIPPSLGYGAAGTGSIPPDATLAFVVDILAAS